MCIVQLNKGSAVDEDRCRMNIEDTFSQTEHQETEHQEGNRDNKVQFTNISLHLIIRIKGNLAAYLLQTSYGLQFKVDLKCKHACGI